MTNRFAPSSETALNNLSQKSGITGAISKLFGDAKYQVTVTTEAAKTFRVQFHAPNAQDVPSIEITDMNGQVLVGSDGNPLALVTTVADGQTESRLANLETLVAANANNRFVFGDNWGVDYSFSDQFLPTFLRPDDSTLTVDTTPATQNGHAIEIDFRNVTNELNFQFESETHAVQTIDSDSTSGTFKLAFFESEVVRLDLKGQTTGTYQLQLDDPADQSGDAANHRNDRHRRQRQDDGIQRGTRT